MDDDQNTQFNININYLHKICLGFYLLNGFGYFQGMFV